MGTVTWVHLSDLHFRADPGHEGRVDGFNRDVVISTLLDDFRSYPSTHDLLVDFVIVTGDIAFSGREDEYVIAEHFFDQVLEILNLSKNHLFLVPGNHDIDQAELPPFRIDLQNPDSITQLLLDDEAKKVYFRRLHAYKDFVNRYLSGHLLFEYGRGYYWTKSLDIEGVSVRLLGLNSAWNSSGKLDTDKIVLGEKQVREVIGNAETSDMVIALVHHPPESLCEIDRPRVERLLKANCHFIAHGHSHSPGFGIETAPDSQMIKIPAGAVYQGRQRTNAYNYVRFDSKKKTGIIHFRRYSDQLSRWVADTETCPSSLGGTYLFALCRPVAPPTVSVLEQGGRPLPTPIYGREDDISEVLTHLKVGSLAVVGIKGIGKSKLLSAAFEKARQDPSLPFEAFYWARFDYKVPPSFTDFARQFLKDLTGGNVEFRDTKISDQVRQVANVLDDRNCLLVIDQFESVIQGSTRQPEAGFLELLRTAKQSLGRARLLVSAWEVPEDHSGSLLPHMWLGGISTSAALSLATVAREFGSSRQFIDEATLSLMRTLVQRLDGHPMSIELILGDFSSQGLQRMLTDDTIWVGGVEAIASKIASRAFNRIDSVDVRQMLTAVCLFSKPCTLEAAAHVAATAPVRAFVLLNELRLRSLVSCNLAGSYDVHVLVRDHVLSQLSDHERTRLHERAADFFLNQPGPIEDSRQSIRDVQPILDAIDHLVLADKYSEALNLFLRKNIHGYLFCWRHLSELKRIYERFLQHNFSDEVRSLCLGNLGMVHRDLLDYIKAREFYYEALDLARKSGSIENECYSLINLGDVHYFMNEIETSIDYHQQAEKMFRKLNNRKLESRNYGCLGNAFSAKKDLNKAKEYYMRAIDLSRHITDIDKRYEGIWTGDLGLVEEGAGRYPEAESYYLSAIRIADVCKDARHRSWWRGSLGDLYRKMGKCEEAQSLLLKAIEIARSTMDNRSIASQLLRLAQLYEDRHDFPAALSTYEELERFYQETGNESGRFEAQWCIGNVLFLSGQFREATELWDRILTADADNEDRVQGILRRVTLADRFVELGRHDLALLRYEAAYEAWKSCGAHQANEAILLMLCDKLQKAGEGERAIRILLCELGREALSHITSPDRQIDADLSQPETPDDDKRRRSQKGWNNLDKLEFDGIQALMNQSYIVALETFQSAIDLSRARGDWKHETKFLAWFARTLACTGEFEKAREELEAAIHLAEDHKITDLAEQCRIEICSVYVAQAQNLVKSGAISGAKNLGKLMITWLPNSAVTQRIFGIAFQSLGRQTHDPAFLELGVQAFGNAINADPKDSLACQGQADCYALSGNLGLAIKGYEAASRVDPSNTSAILSRIEVEIWAARYSDARSTYWKNNNSFKSTRDQAIGAWLVCTALALDGMEFHDYLGILDDPDTILPEDAWQVNDIEPYYESLRSAGWPEERLRGALYLHSLLKSKMAKWQEAKATLERDMAMVEKLRKAEALFNEGDIQAALEQCNEVMNLDPANATAYMVRGDIYSKMSKRSDKRESLLDQAIADFSEAIKKEPDSSEAFGRRGNSLAYRGRLHEALSDYQKAIELDPRNINATLSKMEMEIWLCQYLDALRTLDVDSAKLTVMSPQRRLVWAYFYCLACVAVEKDCGEPFSLLEDDLVRITRDVYDPEDMESNFLMKEQSIIPENRRIPLREVHALFKKHYYPDKQTPIGMGALVS